MADFIHQTGVLVVRDPRVSSADNDAFLAMMQRYYEQPTEVRVRELGARWSTPSKQSLRTVWTHATLLLQRVMEDARPELSFQVPRSLPLPLPVISC